MRLPSALRFPWIRANLHTYGEQWPKRKPAINRRTELCACISPTVRSDGCWRWCVIRASRHPRKCIMLPWQMTFSELPRTRRETEAVEQVTVTGWRSMAGVWRSTKIIDGRRRFYWNMLRLTKRFSDASAPAVSAPVHCFMAGRSGANQRLSSYQAALFQADLIGVDPTEMIYNDLIIESFPKLMFILPVHLSPQFLWQPVQFPLRHHGTAVVNCHRKDNVWLQWIARHFGIGARSQALVSLEIIVSCYNTAENLTSRKVGRPRCAEKSLFSQPSAATEKSRVKEKPPLAHPGLQ